MKSYDSIIEALNDLKTRGYKEDFALESTCLSCGTLDLRLNPEEFNVDEIYRFEGDSSPDDSAVVYAISSTTGVKGTVVDGYGVYNDNVNYDMAKKLQTHPLLVKAESKVT